MAEPRITGRVRRAIRHASEDDRLWFEGHPARSHRVRPAIIDEMPGVTAEIARGAVALVRQVEPGFRLRRLFTPWVEIPDDEVLLHALFDLAGESGFDPLPIAAVAERIRLLSTGGRA